MDSGFGIRSLIWGCKNPTLCVVEKLFYAVFHICFSIVKLIIFLPFLWRLGAFGRAPLPSADLFSWADNYCPCENVCGLCDVFIWREPRSSRVSRDLENVLSRFLDFGLGVAAFRFTRALTLTVWKTGV